MYKDSQILKQYFQNSNAQNKGEKWGLDWKFQIENSNDQNITILREKYGKNCDRRFGKMKSTG